MAVPRFLLRKLYRRGSLRALADGFSFMLHNPLADATLVAPPRFVVNGVAFDAEEVEADGVDLAGISPSEPFLFDKGSHIELHFPGYLLRGGNRIHVWVETEEFGELDFLVEDSQRGDEEE